mmetsp:Transcript_114081/g.368984  ORF Transcript_114081/g.368984 Transcript_114081/m.368984 type:complete len:237 (+) Transcript_114081:255-965(+)
MSCPRNCSSLTCLNTLPKPIPLKVLPTTSLHPVLADSCLKPGSNSCPESLPKTSPTTTAVTSSAVSSCESCSWNCSASTCLKDLPSDSLLSALSDPCTDSGTLASLMYSPTSLPTNSPTATLEHTIAASSCTSCPRNCSSLTCLKTLPKPFPLPLAAAVGGRAQGSLATSGSAETVAPEHDGGPSHPRDASAAKKDAASWTSGRARSKATAGDAAAVGRTAWPMRASAEPSGARKA